MFKTLTPRSQVAAWRQVVTAVSITAWAASLALALFLTLHRAGMLRIPSDFEVTGIDISELARPAYVHSGSNGRAPANAVARPISPTEPSSSGDVVIGVPEPIAAPAFDTVAATGPFLTATGPSFASSPNSDGTEGAPPVVHAVAVNRTESTM